MQMHSSVGRKTKDRKTQANARASDGYGELGMRQMQFKHSHTKTRINSLTMETKKNCKTSNKHKCKRVLAKVAG